MENPIKGEIKKKSLLELIAIGVPVVAALVTIFGFVAYDRKIKKKQLELATLQVEELKGKGIKAPVEA